MKQSITVILFAIVFLIGINSAVGQKFYGSLEMERVFSYNQAREKVDLVWAYVDSTFIFGRYEDGTILAGPADARVLRTLLNPNADILVPDTDTLLLLDCGSLWLLPIDSDAPRVRLMDLSADSRFVRAIDHGFARRVGPKIYIHSNYSSIPTDSVEQPADNDYWSISANGTRTASWGWGPSNGSVHWRENDVTTFAFPTWGPTSCSVLADSVVAVWSSNLLISRDRGLTWHHYKTKDIDESLPEEDVTYQSFTNIQARGTDIYVSFVPQSRSEIYFYFSSDLGLTWQRYSPARSPEQTGPAVPYRSGIGSQQTAAGVRFVADSNGTRIVETSHPIEYYDDFLYKAYRMLGPNFSVVDTLYTWKHSLDDCISFDPAGVGTSSWLWFSNGTALVKPQTATTYTERTLPTSPLLSCWVVDSATAIIMGEQGAYVSTDGGATWTSETEYNNLLAFTPIHDGQRLSLWRAPGAGLEIRSSATVSTTGTLLAIVPNTEASQYLISRYGASGCVLHAVAGSFWTSHTIENFADTSTYEHIPNGWIRYADSLTSEVVLGPDLQSSSIIPRIHEANGWVFGISVDANIGLRFNLAPLSVAGERPNPARLLVFPNPANDQCYVKSTDGQELTTVNVYNTLGSLVLSQTVHGPETLLSTSGLPSGVYYLCIGGTCARYQSLVVSH